MKVYNTCINVRVVLKAQVLYTGAFSMLVCMWSFMVIHQETPKKKRLTTIAHPVYELLEQPSNLTMCIVIHYENYPKIYSLD